MNQRFVTVAKWLGTTALLAVACLASAAKPEAPRETIAPAFAHAIENVPGKKMTGLVVDYAPGGMTPAHFHGKAFVVGYVLEGAIRSRLNNGKEQVFRAGESWTESAGAHHAVSENASATEPAKLLAIFVAGSDDKDLVVFDKK